MQTGRIGFAGFVGYVGNSLPLAPAPLFKSYLSGESDVSDPTGFIFSSSFADQGRVLACKQEG